MRELEILGLKTLIKEEYEERIVELEERLSNLEVAAGEEEPERRCRSQDDVDSASIDVLEALPGIDNTYELAETIIVNDIHTVNEVGNQRPVVFNLPGGENNQPSEGFTLGDDNLIGGN